MAALRSFAGIPHPLQLMLLLLVQDPVARDPKPGTQDQMSEFDFVSIITGRTLILNCTLTQMDLPMSANWYKDLDEEQKLVYSENDTLSRGVRLAPGSRTDFSISISNIQPDDTGIYYCLKTKEVLQTAEPTLETVIVVSVIAKPSQPVVRGPPGRIRAGSWASFNCSTDGFYPTSITITWLKDGKMTKDVQIRILLSNTKPGILYQAESKTEVLLGQGDVKSQLTCQVQHSSLEAPLQQTFPLGDILRVPPTVRLWTRPASPVQLNTTVMVICSAESFYPDDAKVELFAKDAPSRRGTAGAVTLNSDGTFSLESSLEVTATEDRNSSLFICLVKHSSQPAIKATAGLSIRTELEESSQQQLIFVLSLGLFLNKIGLVLFFIGLFQIKEHGCCVARHLAPSSPKARQAESST